MNIDNNKLLKEIAAERGLTFVTAYAVFENYTQHLKHEMSKTQVGKTNIIPEDCIKDIYIRHFGKLKLHTKLVKARNYKVANYNKDNN